MNTQQASWRILGAEDFIRLFIRTLGKASDLKPDDRLKLSLMMNDIRLVMVMKYQQEIRHEAEPGTH